VEEGSTGSLLLLVLRQRPRGVLQLEDDRLRLRLVAPGGGDKSIERRAVLSGRCSGADQPHLLSERRSVGGGRGSGEAEASGAEVEIRGVRRLVARCRPGGRRLRVREVILVGKPGVGGGCLLREKLR
jgi:hypothetical protein